MSVIENSKEGSPAPERKAGFYLSEDGEWIPDGWESNKLGDLVNITSSKRVFHSDYKEEGIAFYRSKEIIEKSKGNTISQELFITEEKYIEFDRKHGTPQQGDMLLTSVGTLGIPYVVKNEKFYFKDGNLTWFRNFSGVTSEYLKTWFTSNQGIEQINKITIGSTQSALTIVGLKGMDIIIPPFPEQKAIAAVLGSLDDKIELLREQNQTLEALAQTLFKRWFIDFNFPDENGNPYKDSGGKMIPSELGEIPEGWNDEGLTSYLNVMGGGTPKTSVPEYWNGEYYFFTPKDAKSGFYCISTEKSVTQSGIDNSSTKLFPEDTIFVTARGTVGKTSLALLPMTMNQSCYALKEKNSHNFTGFLLLREAIHKLQKYATGGVFDAITTNTLASTLMAYPSESLVATFESIVLPIFNKVRTNTQQIQTLTKLRDTLLPKLMKGEIRISL